MVAGSHRVHYDPTSGVMVWLGYPERYLAPLRDLKGVKTLKKFLLATAICALLGPSTTYARKVDDWSYDRLFKEAELVVIAHVQGFSASKQEWREKVFDKDRFEGVETIFGASSVLKGEAPLCIHLVHFQYTETALSYNNGPTLVSFFRNPVSLDVTQRNGEEGERRELKPKRQSLVSKPEYLLFLKIRKDGLYEAVSGQMDPNFSVRALFEYRVLN